MLAAVWGVPQKGAVGAGKSAGQLLHGLLGEPDDSSEDGKDEDSRAAWAGEWWGLVMECGL